MKVRTPEPVKRVMNYQISVSKILMIVLIAVGLKFGWDHYMSLQTELAIAQQNEKALKDSVRVTQNKYDEAVYSKQIFVAETQKDLKNLNSDLAETARKFRGAVHSISNLEAKIDGLAGQIDSDGEVIDLPNGQKAIPWNFDEQFDVDNSRKLSGITRFAFNPNTNVFGPPETEILTDEINFKLTQGLKTAPDGKIEMFASSNYPGFTAKSLNSVLIDPKSHPALTEFTKKKKWSLGAYGGYGVTVNTKSNEVIMGPQIGAGISYTLFSW
jgi:hypothetical protein